jgi:methionyl-tRNA formyltransferase
MEWEPLFTQNIENISKKFNATFYKTAKIHDTQYSQVWNNKPDIIFVVGWRYLIPPSVYNSAKIGCFVFHDSMLPMYRGFGPTVWAMRNGENFTGASLFKIAEEMDEGPLLEQRKITITNDDYIGDVVNKITQTYVDILECVFPKLSRNKFDLVEQNHKKATYTCKSIPGDFKIDWSNTAESIRNMIRAYSPPYPGSFCYLNGKKITILKADIDESKKYVGLFPGRVVRIVKGLGVYIATSDALLLIREIRVDDGEKVNASSVIDKISMTLE